MSEYADGWETGWNLGREEAAARIRELEAEISVERHNLAISEHQRRELEAEVARLRAELTKKLCCC